MAKNWKKYEALVLFDANLGVEGSEELIDKFRGFITDAGGRMLKTERWGVRKMAFEINHHEKAYYVLFEFAGLGEVSTEFARQLNLIDIVIKFQTVKLAEGVDPEELPDTEENIIPEEPKAEEEVPAKVEEDDDDEDDDDEDDDDEDDDDEDEDDEEEDD
ncbi:MAG: 30S ribosomal protein S6 [Deltaproteobacteria bacterium]|nr:MAG: 30S ribosomal protein S6 [Deltaproteobacteria bacterium]